MKPDRGIVTKCFVLNLEAAKFVYLPLSILQ